MPDLRLLSQTIVTAWLKPNYTVRWQVYIGVSNLPS